MSNAPAQANQTARTGVALRWVGWAVALICISLRALVGTEPFPYWDVDPTHLLSIPSGLTPAWSHLVDVAIIASAGVALIGHALAGAGVSLLWTALALIGAVGVGAHALVIGGGSLEDARIGSTWIAAIVAGVAGMHACRDERLGRITLAVSIGIVAMFAAKGVLQLAIEHPTTLQQYRANPGAFLASQGWSEGSASVRAFERRLSQPEATGWFGLANVYASFAAAALVALVGWSVLAWRRARDPDRPLPDGWAGLLSVGAVCAAVATYLAGSKGGITGAGLGLALLAGGMIVGRQPLARRLTPRVGGLLAVALVLSALAALVVRGAIGERVGEPSLLFRWFYLQGAARVFAGQPLWGVGPAGFKDAYMLAKPPLSPEEVQSPHSVMFDYAATLGAFGLAWIALWLVWVYRLGATGAAGISAVARPEERRDSELATVEGALSEARVDGWVVLLLASIPALVSAWIEGSITTVDGALARLLGLGAWIGVAIGALPLMRIEPAWRWVAAVAALVVAVHSQIEVTPVWGGSACLALVIMATAGAGTATPGRARAAPGLVAGVLVVGLAVAWGITVAAPTGRWERALASAAFEVRPLAEINARLDDLAAARGQSTDSMAKIVADASAMAGVPAARNGVEFDRVMYMLTARLTAAAALHLEEAAAVAPVHLQTIEALCRLKLSGAKAHVELQQREVAGALGEEAVRRAEELVRVTVPPSAGAYGLLGTTWSMRAQIEGQPEYLTRAIGGWERAAALDPHGLTFPLRIFKSLWALGRTEEAKTWAQRALDADRLQRLDPLKGMTDIERAEAEQALRGR